MAATACAWSNMNCCLPENSNSALQQEILDALPALVRALVQLGHTLGVAMMAQGIETAEPLDALRRLGRELGQGRFLSGPLPAPQAWGATKSENGGCNAGFMVVYRTPENRREEGHPV